VERCDVLVVGGGPAGSTCAARLVRAGLDVVVLDAKSFPRDKVCAGWITPQIAAELRLDLDDYAKRNVLQPFLGFEVSLAGERSARVVERAPISYGIRRCEFDDYLLRRCGARLRLGEPLKQLAREGAGWVANSALAARVVVGAGGHFCPVARSLSDVEAAAEPLVAAQEIEFALDDEQARRCTVSPEVPELFFERDLRGYAWLVRKGPVLNVGIGRQDPHDLAGHAREFLARVADAGKLPPRLPPKRHGHAYLLYGQAPRPLAGDGFALIGDAAGFAWPQSGEGIRPAVESALLAADAIARGALADYPRAVEARFGPRAGHGPGLSALVPAKLRPWLAGKLLGNPSFARRVVIDRWFLHRNQPALIALSAQPST
jgi:geranylgeranyl reductase family protein